MKIKKAKSTSRIKKTTPLVILPADSDQGFLILSTNKSALFINPPTQNVVNQYTLDDIKNTIGDRALERFAKNRGQSGFKLNTDNSASIKFLKEKVRIDCVLDEQKTIKHEDQILTVPSYTPTKIRKI